MTTAWDILNRSLEGDGTEAWIAYLGAQRWFGGKGAGIDRLQWSDWACADSEPKAGLAWLDVCSNGETATYMLPLAIESGAESERAIVATGGYAVHDVSGRPEFALSLLEALRTESVWSARHGRLYTLQSPAFEAAIPADIHDAHVMGAEQTNTSIRFGRAGMLKLIRRIATGVNLDAEVLSFLNARRFLHVPSLLGEWRYERAGAAAEASVALLVSFVPNEGDGWSYVLNTLKTVLGRDAGRHESDTTLDEAVRRLGTVTAELHQALSTPTGDPAFDPEPITREEAEEWRRDILRQIEGARAALRRTTPPSMLPTSDMIEQQLAGLERLSRDGVMRIRVHGDYHLGQVLRTHGGFTVLDFEGEPARPLAQRRKKLCALKDVAGMLRSFSYVARFAVREPGHRAEASRDAMHGWEERAAERFLDGYLAQARPGHACFLPRDRAGVEDVLRAFLIEKAAYEVAYEANNRPTWLDIPIEGLRKFTPA